MHRVLDEQGQSRQPLAEPARGPSTPTSSRAGCGSIPPASGFLYYTDSYGTNMPYLYFSSYAAGNDFNTGVNSDCPPAGVMGLNVQVQPYQDVNGMFINGKGFQIICAGKNGQSSVRVESGTRPRATVLGSPAPTISPISPAVFSGYRRVDFA